MTVAFSEDMVTTDLNYLNSSSIKISIKSTLSNGVAESPDSTESINDDKDLEAQLQLNVNWEPVSLE